jgi:hypothetical protein
LGFSGGKHAGRYRILMVAACASLLIGQDVWPQGNPSSEYAIKAAFLFHFAQFAEWPATAFKDATTPLTFCTLGENEFHGALDDSISGKRIGNRTLRVQRLKEPQGAAECQVIFVGGNDKKRIPALLASLKDAPVLTVGDTENFVQNGGMIGLFLEDSKVRFEINLDSVERAKLRISATLLALARTVIGGSRGN